MSEAAGSELRSAAEAILIVADEPVTTSAIAEALGMEESVCEELLKSLAAEYRGEAPGSRAHGFLLRRAGGASPPCPSTPTSSSSSSSAAPLRA